MDRLSLHVRRETDLLARQADARRREDVDAARLQLANAEYDFHRYCIGELTLPELVDRVTGALLAGQPMRLPRHDQAPSQLGEIDAQEGRSPATAGFRPGISRRESGTTRG
jgi:hypothetical protein